ncbi:MAG: 30S ribosomal protein S18 [Blastocatellia bacterium]|nr:30S ribosomal protein S18 [Blastocatellia bacterium]
MAEEQSSQRRPSGGGQRLRTPRRKKRCPLLEDKIDYIDYKDVRLLKQFLSENQKILPRRLTGVSTTMQRRLATAIKRAKQIALLPYN